MTSASFESIALDSIIIDRANRQRKTLKNVNELAESIRSVGLINPPVVTRDLLLVAGERRTEACRLLGWTSIPVQYADQVEPDELALIELEENVKRLDLTWQEQNDAITDYYLLQKKNDPAWNQSKTAEALGMSPSAISQHLIVAKGRRADKIAGIEEVDKFSTAIGLSQRAQDRANAAVERDLAVEDEVLGLPPLPLTEGEPPAPPAPKRKAEILNEDFLQWSETRRKPFNLIHCDFPYGVSTGDKDGQSAAKRLGSYDDSEATYWKLVNALITNGPNFIAPSAHLIFWFSLKFYSLTKEALEAGGWKVDPFPLIWHKSDNAGIIPDKDRGGRRTYETAFFASRGDRKVVRPVAISHSSPTTKDFHTSEKPAAMLSHFFRMTVDSSTRLLDPTCGSGMAVRVAEESGAAKAVGLEVNAEFAELAKKNCSL